MIKRKALCALLTVGMTVVLTGVVSAQSITPSPGLLGEFKKKSLVGSWVETFTFADGPRQGQVGTALVNYNRDGTLIGPQGGSVAFDSPPQHQGDPQTGSITSDGTGVWTQTEWNTFIYTSYALFSDFNGNVTGALKVKGRYHLDLPCGDGYFGHSFYEILDKNLNSMVPPITGFVTNVGKRFTVDLRVPPLPTPSPTP